MDGMELVVIGQGWLAVKVSVGAAHGREQ